MSVSPVRSAPRCSGVGPALFALSVSGWIAVYVMERELQKTVCGSLLRLRSAPTTDARTCLTLAGAWATLTLSMMAPALANPVNHVWRSLSRRSRSSAVLCFIAAYPLVWLAADARLVELATSLSALVGSDRLVYGASELFLAWQLSPVKQLCLNRCHHVRPLAPFGLRARVDQMAFGTIVGFWYVGACWPMMFLMLASGIDNWVFMLAGSVLIFVERLLPLKPMRRAAMLRQWVS